jgi:hypothetical protein
MLLTVENNLDQLPSTLNSYLSVAGTAGGTAIPVKNIAGYQVQWAIQLGRTGEEQAEILNIDNIGGTVLNTSGTAKFSHPLDTPVYQVHYDKIIFLRSTSGTTGTPVALATVAITPDSQYTEYNDSSGVATYAYQTQYYNSVSGDTSGTSSWFVPGGPTFYSLQRLRDRGKKSLFGSNFIQDDTIIDDWINEWVEIMTNKALKVNESYSVGTASYSFGTAGLGTITEPLFKYASKIEVTTDGITYRPSTMMNVNAFSDQDIFDPLNPKHYWQGDVIFGVKPNGVAGTARMTLGKISTQLTEDTDELPQFLRSYTAYCIEYLLYRANSLDQKDQIAESHYRKVIQGQVDFIREITPRDQTGPQLIDLVDSLSGMQEDNDFII